MTGLISLAMLVVVPVPPEPRPFSEVRADMRAALQADAGAQDGTQRSNSIVALTRVYQEIKRDPRLAKSETLERYRVRVRARLMQRAEEIRRQLAPASSRSGRPRGGRGGGAAIPDYGPRLVALIERTIAPDFWDVHGGPGTIAYYRPLRVLVVRATDDVHGQVGGLIGALR